MSYTATVSCAVLQQRKEHADQQVYGGRDCKK